MSADRSVEFFEAQFRLNVLIEGTTCLALFDPEDHYLFHPGELEHSFSDWPVVLARNDSFEAPGNTCRVLTTIVAERPRESPSTPR